LDSDYEPSSAQRIPVAGVASIKKSP